MNGGVEHALEGLSQEERRGAVAGYRYFSFDLVAEMLEDARVPMTGSAAGAADERYWGLIADDDTLARRFEEVFAARREVFAPG